MSEIHFYNNYEAPSIPNKIYEFFKNSKFSKMSEFVEKFIFQLDTSSKNSYQIEEINFVSEISVKACKKLIKQRKLDHQLISLTTELTNKYSNSTRIIYLHKLNQAEALVKEGKFSESKKLLKSYIAIINNYPDCLDLFSKLLLTLSHIYLKQEGKHDKSLKFSQKTLDQCFKRVNTSQEAQFFKSVIEALLLKGLYYVKTMEFQQAQKMLDKAKEICNEKTLCKHLSSGLRNLEREITSLGSRKSTKRITKPFKHSGTLEVSPSRYDRSLSSFTIMPSLTLQDRENKRIYNENVAASKLQNFFRMAVDRKKYLTEMNYKVLCTAKKRVDNVDIVLSASVNSRNDVVIRAIPLQSGLPHPVSFFISSNKREEFGIEDLQQLPKLLGWVCITGNMVFVPHMLNKKRLIFKTVDCLSSETRFCVKIFEAEEVLVVQACGENTYEVILKKNLVPEQFLISPLLLVKKVRLEGNRLVYG